MESLYRKYRPQTFESMVGQKHIVSTLQNALADGRMAHAYLFTGPRGTGKTTTARLLAKALMCEKGAGGATAHPDGTCEECEEIASGMHPDVFELDAASRTGVDNVREEIINRVAFAPVRGSYKVYVIDEVHMLSPQAFNALLKTLEEPPAHVVFVMCTTDPQKIPETVLSRCQRLEFHRISDADIAERLEHVCQAEGFGYEPEAIELVARHARGGLRDALSTLETLSIHGRGQVRAEDARAVLGEVADDSLTGMVELIAARDAAGCFARVSEMAERGVDLEQYSHDLTRYMRNIYVASVAGESAFSGKGEADAPVRLAELFGGPDRLSYALEVLCDLQSAMKSSIDQRLDLEVALTRMARPGADMTVSALAARVEMLERELAALKASGVAGVGAPAAAAAAAAPASATPVAPAASAASVAPAAAPAAQAMPARPATAPATSRPAAAQPQGRPQPQAPARPQAAQPAPTAQAAPAPVAPSAPGSDPRWPQIAQLATQMSLSTGALLNNAVGWVDADGTLVVENRGSSFAAQMLVREKSMQPLKAAAAQVLGREVAVRVVGVGAAPTPARAAAPATAHPAATATPATPAASVAPARPATPATSVVPARPAAPAQPAPDPAPRPAPAPAPSRVAPAPAPAPRPAAPAVPLYDEPPAVSEAPEYEFVPDDVYDGYLDESAEIPPEPTPEARAVEALTGASKKPVPPAPAPGRTYAAPWEDVPASRTAEPSPAPKSAPAALAPKPAAPDQAPDDPAASLSEMLSAGFGGFVRVTREP